jgi:hypothetical protein
MLSNKENHEQQQQHKDNNCFIKSIQSAVSDNKLTSLTRREATEKFKKFFHLL